MINVPLASRAALVAPALRHALRIAEWPNSRLSRKSGEMIGKKVTECDRAMQSG
jgi:hypothetical protein